MRKRTSGFVAALGGAELGFLAACGGGGVSNSPPPQPAPAPVVVISAEPTGVPLPIGGAIRLNVNVGGVTWTVVEGASGGTIASFGAYGLYTAPEAPGTYHVFATSQGTGEKSAILAIAVTALSPGTNFSMTGSMGFARADHTATLLSDGSVLITGGAGESASDYSMPYVSAVLYDSASGTFIPTGSLHTAREGQTATLLASGSVLVAGGADTTAELYDPATRSFATTGNMAIARSFHTATALPDGRVLLAGGRTGDGTALASAELYEPVTGAFSLTGSLSAARWGDFTATLLHNGAVLIVGGWTGSATLASAELYVPATGRFSPTGSLGTARFGHTATLLADGRVLIAGGFDVGEKELSSAELYDPGSGSFRATGEMGFRHGGHSATLLPDGRVLIAAGVLQDVAPHVEPNAELFDPASGNFMLAGTLSEQRTRHTATLLSDGRVLISGGCYEASIDGSCFASATAELYP